MRLGNNYVLIDIGLTVADITDQQYTKTKSGLVLDSSYFPGKFLPRDGVVKAVCDKLLFSKDPQYNGLSMEWETDIEVRVGDTAYLEYIDILFPLGLLGNTSEKKEDPRWCQLDGVHRNTGVKCKTVHVFVKYSGIILVVRDNKIIPVNGNMLLRAVNEDKPKSILIDLSHIKDKFSERYGIADYVGVPNKRYREDGFYDADVVDVGDYVLLHRKTIVKKLEYGICAKLFPDTTYYYLQRRMVQLGISQEQVEKIFTDKNNVVNLVLRNKDIIK